MQRIILGSKACLLHDCPLLSLERLSLGNSELPKSCQTRYGIFCKRPALHAKDHSGQQSMPSAWLSFAVLGKVVPGKLRATQIMPNSIRYFLQTSCTPCKGSFWPAKHAFCMTALCCLRKSCFSPKKTHAKLYTVVSVDSAAWGFFPAGSGVLSTDVLSTDVLSTDVFSTAGPWNMPPCSRQ